MKLKMLLLAAAASISTPAMAVSITYTLSGDFAGTLNGGAFSIGAVFTGVGDTSTYANVGGGVSEVNLSSLSALAGGTTYNLVGSYRFFNNASIGVAGFSFLPCCDKIDFSSASFASYDPRTSIGPIAVTQFYLDTFVTDQGTVTLSSATNLSFSAASDVVGGAVPEPATWGLMVLGFGSMGYAMRSRRKIAVSFS